MKNLHEFLNEKELATLPISEQKKTLRKKLLSIRSEAHRVADPQNWGPRQYFRALELLKIKKIEQLENIYQVACFFPIRDELDFTPFAQKKWLFPKTQQNGKLFWFEYGDGVTNYTTNSIGIKEKEEEHCFPYTQNSLPLLCFVPGIAASQDGSRLGYGGGFYDQFLSQFPDKITSVLCLPSQDFLLNALPLDPHDEKVDLIVF
jgi:5-formyltetrahydrofolate cyclo-ligase